MSTSSANMNNMLAGGDSADNPADQKPLLENETDHESVSAIESFLRKAKDGLNGVFFVMSKETRRPFWMHLLGMCIDAAQLSAFALERTRTIYLLSAADGDNADTIKDFAPSLRFISSVSSYFDFIDVLPEAPASVIMALTLVCALMVNVVYVGYSWVTQDFHYIWTVRLLRSTASLMVGAAYIPIMSVFVSTLTCANDLTNPAHTTCILLEPLVMLIGFFFIVFALAVTLTFYDPRPHSSGIMARPHSRVAALHQLLRTMLTIISGLMDSYPDLAQGWVRVWAGLVLASSSVLLIAYVWFQPYYNAKINTIRSVLMAIFFWSSVSTLVHVSAIAEHNSNSAFVFFSGLLLLLPLVRHAVIWRKQALLEVSDEAAANLSVLDVEMKGRFMLAEAQASSDPEDTAAATKARVAIIYSKAIIYHSESSLICVFQAQFLLSYMGEPLLARRALLKASERSTTIDVRFTIFKTRKDLEENAFRSSDVLTFVAREKHLKMALSHDRRCCSLMVQFWRELALPGPNLVTVRRLSDSIAVQMNEATSNYKRLMSLSSSDERVLALYSGFTEDVANDSALAQQLKLRLQHLRHREKRRRKTAVGAAGRPSNSGIAFGAGNAVITVDACQHVGRIVAVSSEAAQLFNQPSDAIVGKLISSMLLPPFQEDFEPIVERYLENGDLTYFGKTMSTFIRLSNSIVLPCHLTLKPFTEDGINFKVFVSIVELQFADQESMFVLSDPSCRNRIIGATGAMDQSIASRWGIKRGHIGSDARNEYEAADSNEGEIHIDDLLPGFMDVRDELLLKQEPQKMQMINPSADKNDSVEVDVSVQSIPIHLGACSLDKISISGVDDNRHHASPRRHIVDDDEDDEDDDDGDDDVDEDNNNAKLPQSLVTHSDISGSGFDNDDRGSLADADEVTLDPADVQIVPAYDEKDDDENASAGPGTRPGSVIRKLTFESLVEHDESTHHSRFRFSRPSLQRKPSIPSVSATPIHAAGAAGGATLTSRPSILKNSRRPSRAAAEATASKSDHADNCNKQASSAGSSSAFTQAAFIRRLMLQGRNRLDPTLARFRRLWILVLVIAILLASSVFFIDIELMAEYAENIMFTNQAGLRRTMCVSIAYLAHSLVLLQSDIVLPSGHDESVVRELLRNAATSLKDLDMTLFSNRELDDAELRDMYEVPMVELRSIRSGVVQHRLHTLYDASVQISGLAMKAANTPLEQLTPDSEIIYTLTNNILPSENQPYLSHLEALNQSTAIFSRQGEERIESVNYISFVLAFLIAVGILAMLLGILLPMVNRIDLDKSAVLDVLVGIPGHVISKINQRYINRLRTVHDTIPESADLLFEDQTPPKRTASNPRGSTASVGRKESRKLSLISKKNPISAATKLKLSAAFIKRTPAAKRKLLSQGWQSKASKWSTVLKMSVIFFMYLVYISTSLYLNSWMSEELADAPSEANYAGLRRTLAKLTMLNLRLLAAGPAFGAYTVNSTLQVESIVDELDSLHFSLLHGNFERHLKGFFARNSELDSDHEHLLLHDGCYQWPDDAIKDLDECASFDNGVMQIGLNGALNEFRNRALTVLLEFSEDISANPNRSTAAVNSTLALPHYVLLSDMERFFLAQGLSDSVKLYGKRTAIVIEEDKTLKTYALLIFIGATIFFDLLVARRLILSLDNEVKRTRALLLMVPEDVMQNLKSAKKFLMNHLQSLQFTGNRKQ